MKTVTTAVHFDFMRRRKPALFLSIILILISLGSLITRGLNFGIDFTGGTLIEVAYPTGVSLDGVRVALKGAGYDGATVQYFGTPKDVLIRVAPRAGISAEAVGRQILLALKAQDPRIQLRRSEFVGPQVGKELTEQGGLAMLYALIGILIYVALRFEKRFSLGAVAALVHDVIVTLGVFSLFHLNFDLTVLAALLAVIGYSLNDTIVIFDRIRENFRRLRKGDVIEIMNISINQTLSRTLVTGITTLLVLVALLAFGGEVIRGFSLALIVGIVVGTYSSIYIASVLALYLGVSRADLIVPGKEGGTGDQV